MSAVADFAGSRIGAAETLRRSTAPSRFLLGLVIIGMVAALVEVISFQMSLQAQGVANPGFSSIEIIKTPLFYRAYAMQLFCGLAAGLGGMIALNFRNIEGTYPMRFWLLIAAALLMTFRGYTVNDLMSMKLADSTGPIPFILFMLVFLGANKNNWRVFEKVFVIEAFVISCLVLINITQLRAFSRDESVILLANYLNILLWPAAWVFLSLFERNPWIRRFRYCPILVYTLGSLFVQTRLNFVMLSVLLFLFGYIQKKRGQRQAMTWILSISALVWLGLFAAIFLRDSSVFQKISNVADAFYSRLDEDTRTGQLAAFARDVRPSELVLGRGSFATWKWGSMLWKGGTDVGYLSLLLYGGLPLLFGYIGAQVIPSLRLFNSDAEEWQLPSAAVVLMFAVRMFSSSYPGENLESYALLLCTGACLAKGISPVFPQFRRTVRYKGEPHARPLVYK